MKIIIALLICLTPEAFGHEICLNSDGKKQPLVFDSHKVIYPSAICGQGGRGELFQSDAEKMYVACIGSNNNVISVNDDGREAALLTPGSTALNVLPGTNFSCSSVNKATVVRDRENDVDGHCRAFKTGFDVPVPFAPFFHTVFTVCWNDTDQHPKWVRNPINPNVVSEISIDEDLIDTGIRGKFRFSKAVFGKDYNPRKYYSVSYQKKVGLINTTAGSDFYARGHLAPAGDFFLAAERWATFSLENVVPQWQSHNSGAWKEIETKARRVKDAYMAETGPIYNSSAEKKFLDTDNNLLPIPDELYKIVYDKNGKELYREKSKMLPRSLGRHHHHHHHSVK